LAKAEGGFDVEAVRADFPLLARCIGELPIAYLDSAASAQKPEAVLHAMDHFQRTSYANVHRGVHRLAAEATAAFDGARARIARFIGAQPDEVVFVRGTTEAINLVAWSFVAPHARAGDEVLVTAMEHHANIVPWQLVGARTGLAVVACPLTASAELDLDALAAQLARRPRLLAVTHVSNVLGVVNPIREIVDLAHAHGVPVLIDGAQAIHHLPVDVVALGCDFYAFSSHKAYGPSGTGVLWGRRELLAAMPPWQGGGDMIRRVSFAGTTFAAPPERFEAGTPDIVGAIGFAAALDYLAGLDRAAVARHEADLLAYAEGRLAAVPGLRILGAPGERIGVLSFDVAGVHPHDLATVLDRAGIAVRAGHHCAQPLHDALGLAASTRASFALYNTRAEVDRLVAAVGAAQALFA
jgi:cysteine desulfurase/selenocysteine lyase